MESSLKSDFTFMTHKRSEKLYSGMNKDEELHALLALDMSGSIDDETASRCLVKHMVLQKI